jgi:excisionase family DNA binding protein
MTPTEFLKKLEEISARAKATASGVKREAITSKELATLLDVSVRTIQRRIAEGLIKTVKIGHSLRIPRDEIKRLRATSSKTNQ